MLQTLELADVVQAFLTGEHRQRRRQKIQTDRPRTWIPRDGAVARSALSLEGLKIAEDPKQIKPLRERWLQVTRTERSKNSQNAGEKFFKPHEFLSRRGF
ncbi:MAG: hypothetical protein DMG98_23645 [Acidobacteria bacterium]|nr:MAG: hypothetical protein DMG98_23645 [Acidobacteriota bacterium]